VVALDFHPEAEAAAIDWTKPLPEVPTVPTPLEEITSSVTRIAQKLERLPMDEIASDLRGSLEALRSTLSQTERTLVTTQGLLSPGSPVLGELQRTLVELGEASRALGLAADQIEREPESLIFGKEKGE
jgi:paraquat-inducible protein B